ncbi:MAG: terminase family protein [Planctomycetota bacterium]|nr:terminase family protein [Planctomycetota bacterium]
MSAPIHLREAARTLYKLREEHGWEALEDALEGFTDAEIAELCACWQLSARDAQLRPEGAVNWLIMAGRGFGKTRAGAEDTLDVQEEWGENYRGLLVSKAYQRDIEGVMLHGESGLIACAERRGYKLEYVSSKSRVYFPSGGYAVLISADNPEAFRGPQFNHVWADEIAKWNKPDYCWNNILLALRLKIQKAPPRTTVTTTPKRGSAIVLTMLRDPKVIVTRGSTLENVANLDEERVQYMIDTMGGSAFGRQELDGEMLEGSGVMAEQDVIDRFRVKQAPHMPRRIVSFDPAITDSEDSDDHGIVALGEDASHPRRAFVLADRTMSQGSPEAAARRVVRLAKEWRAESIVAELNQGGKWIESLLHVAMQELEDLTGESHFFPIVGVWARHAKEVRAEPVGALYELGRVCHVGKHSELEKQASTWIPGMPSPNQMDALVHGVSHLLLGPAPARMTGYAKAR